MKTKEGCKDAARLRRESERVEFAKLASLLPLPSTTTNQLDKASIIRLTTSYLRMRQAFPEGLGNTWGCREQFKQFTGGTGSRVHQHVREIGSLLLQTIEGFVFALQSDGKIMYISETASVHLGLPQMDLTGSSVYDYIHPDDQEDLRQVMKLSEREKMEDASHEVARSFCIRMKCILPKRNAGLAIANYKPIHCTGYLKLKPKLEASKGLVELEWESYALVAVGHSLLPTASIEFKLTNSSFMFRASLDFKFYYVEPQISKLLGLNSLEMVGASLYHFVHVGDVEHLKNSHKSLLEKGQAVTKYYRLMKQSGGFIWVQSYISVVFYPRHLPKPQNIVSVNLVIADEQLDSSCFSFEPSTNLKGNTLSEFVPAQQADKLCLATPTTPKQLHGTSLLVGPQLQTNRRPPPSTELPEKLRHPCRALKTGEPARKYIKLKAHPGTKYTPNDNSSNHHKNNEYQQEGPPLLIPTSTISLRRTSDDTCSVVSSLASSSGCSYTSSLSHHNSDFSTYTTGDSYSSVATTATVINDLTYQLQQEPTTSTNAPVTPIYRNYSQPQPDLQNQQQLVWPKQQLEHTRNRMEKLMYDHIAFDGFTTESLPSNNTGTHCLYFRPETLQQFSDNNNQDQQPVIDTGQSSIYMNRLGHGIAHEQPILLSASNKNSYLNQQPQYYESPNSYSSGAEPVVTGCSTCMPYRHQVSIDSG